MQSNESCDPQLRKKNHFPGPDSDPDRSYPLRHLVVLLSASLFMSLTAVGQDVLVIKKQSVTSALTEFAEKTGLQVVYPSDLTEGLTTVGAKATSPDELLAELLRGTNLSFEYVNPNTITLVKNKEKNGVNEMEKQSLKLQSSRSQEDSLFRRFLTAITAGFVAGGAGSSVAAEGNASQESIGVIDEIVVTARKREESLQDVPAAITAFNEGTISRFNINTLDEMAQLMPGLIISEAAVSSGGEISLRGIGSGSSNYLSDQAVAINVDGMQVGSFNVRKAAQIDLAQIEVLRGPQALFFGKNSPGGVISMKTANPTDVREVELLAGYESESGDAYYQALYSGPVGENVGIRLVGRYTDLGGYFDLRTVEGTGNPLVVPPHVSSWPEGEEVFVRATLSADPTDSLEIKAKISYNESEIKGGSLTPSQRFDCPLGAPQLAPPYECRLDKDVYIGGAPEVFLSAVPGAASLEGLGLRENEQILGTLEINYEFQNDLTLSSVTGFYDFDEVNAHNASKGPMATVLIPFLPFKQTQWTQELRLASNYDSSVNFMIGAFLETKDTESSQDGVVTLFGFPFVFGAESTIEDQQAFSAFGQITWQVADTVELSGGLRYSHEEKELEYYRTGTDVTSNLADDSISFENLSPEISVSWDIADEVMLFATYKEAFKSGGFDAGYSNGGVLFPGYKNNYDEEEVDGFEVGLKALFSNRLAVNITAYSYEYEDLQVSSFDPETITFKVLNAAEASVEGIEADFIWNTAIDGLSITGSIAYNNAEYDQFLAGCYVGQSINDGCNLTLNPSTGAFLQQDMSGKRLHNAPELGATLGFQYFTTLSNGMGLDLALNSVFSDEYSTFLRQSPQDLQSSYTKLNASLRLIGADEKWEVSLLARNLTDEITINSSGSVVFTGGGAGTNTAFLGDRSAFVSRGREFYLQFTYRPDFF